MTAPTLTPHTRALIDNHAAIPAAFAGRCAGCHRPYPAGEPVGTRAGWRGWRAACCLDEHGRPVR